MEKLTWEDVVYYCEESPSCLRRLYDWRNGWYGKSVQAPAGSVVGSKDKDGYFIFSVGGFKSRCHRVVWEMHNGKLQEGMCIDHIDGDRANNKISNLRAVTRGENNRNRGVNDGSLSGINGVNRSTKITDGVIYEYWTATWKDANKSYAKNFSINKFGDEEAFKMAVTKRQVMMEELSAKGQEYSERHTRIPNNTNQID